MKKEYKDDLTYFIECLGNDKVLQLLDVLGLCLDDDPLRTITSYYEMERGNLFMDFWEFWGHLTDACCDFNILDDESYRELRYLLAKREIAKADLADLITYFGECKEEKLRRFMEYCHVDTIEELAALNIKQYEILLLEDGEGVPWSLWRRTSKFDIEHFRG